LCLSPSSRLIKSKIRIYGDLKSTYKSGEKILLDRPRCKWEDNNGMNFRDLGFENVDCMHLAHDKNQ
jgi:hypothetical protein